MRTAFLGFVGALLVLGCGSSDDDPETTLPAVDLWEQREVVGAVPSRHEGPHWLSVDGDRLFVGLNELGMDGAPSGGRVYAFPKDGGGFEPLGQPFERLRHVHDDGSVLFVVSPGEVGDVLSAVSKDDGATTALGAADEVEAMTADEASVYVACLGGNYGDGPSIQAFERETGTKTELWQVGDVTALAVGGGDLFVATHSHGVWRLPLSLEREALPIGDPQAALPPGAQVTFTAGAERLFWVAAGTLGEVSLVDGALTEQAYGSDAERMGRLASSGDALVWSELDGNGVGVGIWHRSLGSGDYAFAELKSVSAEVATDGIHVYGLTGTEVWRLPLAAFVQ